MNCRNCKFWRSGSQKCTNEDFVRENLNAVSGWGEMMTDIMMTDAGVDTFGTSWDYSCNYFEEQERREKSE